MRILWNHTRKSRVCQHYIAFNGYLSSSCTVQAHPLTHADAYLRLPLPLRRVIALTLDGQELWKSSQLEGVGSGTPVSSASGEQVFLTHNSNFGSTGHFTVLLASMGGQTLFSQQNTTNPFSPVGVYHNPAEGYYDGGEGNTNDIVLWSFQPKPGDSSVGVGATFAFQLPIAYPDKNPTSYILLGAEPRNFQSIVKPVITNEGRSAYFGTSRSGYSCWVGVANLKRCTLVCLALLFLGKLTLKTRH